MKNTANELKEKPVLELLIETSKLINSEVDLEKLVQRITDIGTDLTRAAFGAFFYNVINPSGEKYVLYTISGVPREAFSKFPMPRNTAIFNPTFTGTHTVRYDDVTQQAHYGKSAPYHGMPKGHLPVRSYLAVPVISAIDNEVLGGLFFGHPEVGVFTEDSERLIEGIAAQAAIAMTNARLFEEKKRTEKKLIEQNALISSLAENTKVELEKKVKERTAELEKINYELLQFTSVASHDLKEPLRKISIFSKRLEESLATQLDDTTTRYLANIVQSAGRMTMLIDDLLSFSRLSQEEQSFQSVDLSSLLAQIVSDLEVTINDKRATIKFEQLPIVNGNPLQLGQVFQNLISNSIKFSHPERNPEIVISSEPVTRHGKSYYFIRYADNGIGFENANADKIFEIFQRLHPRDKYEGTGVGLAIVKKIVVMHGGDILAEGNRDQGAVFSIFFPIE